MRHAKVLFVLALSSAAACGGSDEGGLFGGNNGGNGATDGGAGSGGSATGGTGGSGGAATGGSGGVATGGASGSGGIATGGTGGGTGGAGGSATGGSSGNGAGGSGGDGGAGAVGGSSGAGGTGGDGGSGGTGGSTGGAGGSGGSTGGTGGSTGGAGGSGGSTGGTGGSGGATTVGWCSGHCGSSSPIQPGNCFCDDGCVQAGDCCADYGPACNPTAGAGQIKCDNGTCNASSQFCCQQFTSTGGVLDPQCQQSGSTCIGPDIECDGPEDCGGGEVCCSVPAGGNNNVNFECRQASNCTDSSYRIVCGNDWTVCASGQKCIPHPWVPQYNYCTQS